MEYFKCPNCLNFTVMLYGCSPKVSGITRQVLPKSLAKSYPDYIPKAIREDYQEAYAIVNLSPKASATLSRRCLQNMIHDFWGIKLKNLNQEISALQNKVSADVWASIDALRQLGNIGAHGENDVNVIVDINPNEAESLLKLIEMLIEEWYTTREKRTKLLSDITSTNNNKQSMREKK